MSEYSVKGISSGIIIVAIFIAVICVKFALEGNMVYLSVLLFCILLIVMVMFFRRKALLSIANEAFRKQWGTEETRKRNFKKLEEDFNLRISQNGKGFYIDNQTWTDITMNEVYSKIDRTITSPGEDILYGILRAPIFEKEKLMERNKIINAFQKDKDIRERVGSELIKLGRTKKNYIFKLITENIDVDSRLGILVNILILIVIGALISAIVFKSFTGVMLIAVSMGVNTFAHNKFKQVQSAYISSLGYLNGLINTSKNIGNIKNQDIEIYTGILQSQSKKVEKVRKKTIGLGRIEGIDFISDYFYSVFLIEERQFLSSVNYIKKYRNELKELYIKLGEIDALLSIASYRSGLENYVEPELIIDSKIFEVKDMVHPLVKAAVPNSARMEDKGIILTGTNMSGKSTFLRTVAVNALLAQTIYTCNATYYKGSFFKIMTSISPEDNIIGGKSYYFREAEALKRIIEQCNDEYPLLCIVDEIFRGTNPLERVNASAEILSYIDKHNTLTVVATHDLELTEILKDKYECCYFSEDVTEEGLNFDYKLKYGVCRTRNAVKLLKFLNYPQEIIEKTNIRIENTINIKKY